MRPDGRPPGRGPTGPGWQPPPPAPGGETAILGGASIAAAFSDSDAETDSDTEGGSGSVPSESAEVSTRRALRRYGNYASKAARRAIELASSSTGQPKMARVTFWLQFHVEWGQQLRVIGSHPHLGERAHQRCDSRALSTFQTAHMCSRDNQGARGCKV